MGWAASVCVTEGQLPLIMSIFVCGRKPNDLPDFHVDQYRPWKPSPSSSRAYSRALWQTLL